MQSLARYAVRHQHLWPVHAGVIWDLRNLDPSAITTEDLLNIEHSFADVLAIRADIGRRAALLIAPEMETLAGMALAYCIERRLPVDTAAFLDEPEARSWLLAV